MLYPVPLTQFLTASIHITFELGYGYGLAEIAAVCQSRSTQTRPDDALNDFITAPSI